MRTIIFILSTLLSVCSFADAPASGGEAGGFGFSPLILMLVFFAVFYFLIIRPQTKRAKEQKQLTEGVAVGDEISTIGGIVAKVTRLKDQFVVIEISKDVEITIQRQAIAKVFPKGTYQDS